MQLDLRLPILAALCFTLGSAISIDNDIIGEPDIECLDEEIRIWVKTRKVFAGRIYAKGKAEVEECYKDDFGRDRTKKPHFDLKFGVCGMKSLRSVDPRGMYYGITVVVSFHPLFITKVDQAFHVKCFFEEASRGLTAELGVSMIPTTEVEARHGIPGCSYSIHSSSIDDLDAGSPAGPPIQFAKVGDRVLHQWHCNDKMFGVLINNCYVTDGFGKKADVIDASGCPVDPILITGIRYSADLQRAYAESQVFKFADKPGVWFFCQIQMCMKKAGMCKGITPPSCASTAPPQLGSDRGSVGGRAEETTESGDYEEKVEKTTQPRQEKKSTKSSSDYDGDYETDNRELKLHSPDSASYNTATPAVDYETQTEAVTVFGPAFNEASTPAEEPVTTLRPIKTSESVSQSFEAEDDLSSTTKPAKSQKIGKSDYNDYDEVTIPPNLTDLLANLPDDLSADSLQRMFRDSVDNRKALLDGFEMLKKEMKHMPRKRPNTRINRDLRAGDLRSGDKIDQIQVDWTSTRRRDSPIGGAVVSGDTTDTPMIAGQLMIFELDEEPPTIQETKKAGPSALTDCAISRGGLLAVAGGLGSICAALFVAALTFYMKLSSKDDKSCASSQSSEISDRFSGVRPNQRLFHGY